MATALAIDIFGSWSSLGQGRNIQHEIFFFCGELVFFSSLLDTPLHTVLYPSCNRYGDGNYKRGGSSLQKVGFWPCDC
jgi:hypothetical protein